MKQQAREIALQILFQAEFTSPISITEFRDLFEEKADKESLNFADTLIVGVQKHKEELDKLIQSKSAHWNISRMSFVDRNILRMALFEMKFADHPNKPSIVINEAVNIAKKYGTTDSSAFVNGVLDSLAKEL